MQDNNENLEEDIEQTTPIHYDSMYFYQNIPNFYNRVRSALNVGTAISDEEIDYFENAPMAERKIKQRVPDYENLTADKLPLFETCIIYMTCYALCPIVSSRRIARQKDPSLEIEFASGANNEKPCERFLALVDDLISQINEEEIETFFGFKVTPASPCAFKSCCLKHRLWN